MSLLVTGPAAFPRRTAAVRIVDVLNHKGPAVATLQESATVRELVDVLVTRGIGSVVVVSRTGSVAGIVSERDVVTHLGASDQQLLDAPLSSIMNAVVTCTPSDEVVAVLQTMTDRRIRHLPVLDSGRLVGLVSIGDLVKSRIDDLRVERDQMSAYITGSPL
jgi:CBS domain-containing protein